jgi:hypothetical protein
LTDADISDIGFDFSLAQVRLDRFLDSELRYVRRIRNFQPLTESVAVAGFATLISEWPLAGRSAIRDCWLRRWRRRVLEEHRDENDGK